MKNEFILDLNLTYKMINLYGLYNAKCYNYKDISFMFDKNEETGATLIFGEPHSVEINEEILEKIIHEFIGENYHVEYESYKDYYEIIVTEIKKLS